MNVEFQDKKRYLMRYLRVKSKVERLENKLELITDKYTIKAQSYSGMPGGGIPRNYEDMMIEKQIVEKKLDKFKKIAFKYYDELLDCFLLLDNDSESEVLTMYFIDGETLSSISEKLAYSDRQVTRLYVNGINHIEVIAM